MTHDECAVLEAVIKALDVPRKQGRLAPESLNSAEDLRQFAVQFQVGGAIDRVDQAVKVLKYLVKERK